MAVEQGKPESTKLVLPAPNDDLKTEANMTDDLTITAPLQTAQAQAPAELNAIATSVLATLPNNVKPILLSIDFPHVVNKIAELWTRPILLDRYFEELSMDARGGRKGFPLGVALEIANLREHYQTKVRPMKKTTWDMSI